MGSLGFAMEDWRGRLEWEGGEGHVVGLVENGRELGCQGRQWRCDGGGGVGVLEVGVQGARDVLEGGCVC